MKCDLCGVEAKAKTITAKNGKTYSGWECQGGCKNPEKPQYPRFFFAHREEAEKVADPRPKGPARLETAEVAALLKESVSVLKDIRRILANPGKIHVFEDELQPDSEVPF